jgi:hypothetical protein
MYNVHVYFKNDKHNCSNMLITSAVKLYKISFENCESFMKKLSLRTRNRTLFENAGSGSAPNQWEFEALL